MGHDKIAVVDFGGQYAHLIASKIRRMQVLAEVFQPEAPLAAFRQCKGIILSGSPALASAGTDSGLTPGVMDLDIPILGLCFGHQEIARHYGGRVEHTQREYGVANLSTAAGASPLFAGMAPDEIVWMSHGDSVTALPDGFIEIGWTPSSRNAAIADDRRRRYGLQFHPEVDDTPRGKAMLWNFVTRVCVCRPNWTMDAYLDEQMSAIRARAGKRGVFLLASGGVDSTVCAVLIGRAIGPGKLHVLHVDNGLMRKAESFDVMQELRRLRLDKNLHFVDASGEFLNALDGLVEPEAKRRAIGDAFVRVFEQEARRLQLQDMLLGQGTIYPDRIETGGTRRADVIKTHHNRVPAIEAMIAQGRVVEPLADLYKVEVRELGEKLGIDPLLLWRHPFPGPGLGIRALCSDGSAPAAPDGAQAALDELAAEAGLEAEILPVKTVGVKADLRSYELPVLVRGQQPHSALLQFASRAYSSVPGINRCMLDLSGCGKLHPVAATVTRGRLDLLREADDIVMRALGRHGLLRAIWQCPTALLPLSDGIGTELVAVRPVLSERAMTARPAPLPQTLIEEIRQPIMALPGVCGLILDLSTKPPATIELE